ncbi:MAG: diacylglycerol/lipid kinase family protein, partial [Bacillota bacterium]
RSLNLTKNVTDVIATYQRQKIKKVDIGEITYQDFDNIERSRYFINTADVGIGGETVEFVNQSSKIMGGFLTYLYGVIRTLIKYENKKMKLKIDDKVIKDDILNSIMISLGKYFAGGMPIAPEAKVDDGIFDITVLGNLSKLETVLNLYRAYKGTHIYYEKIDYLKGKKVSIESDERVLIDIDGESAGILPAQFQIYKQVFPILV